MLITLTVITAGCLGQSAPVQPPRPSVRTPRHRSTDATRSKRSPHTVGAHRKDGDAAIKLGEPTNKLTNVRVKVGPVEDSGQRGHGSRIPVLWIAGPSCVHAIGRVVIQLRAGGREECC